MTPEELEEVLSRPTPEVGAALAELDGSRQGAADGAIVVAGAGGKMGPSLAGMARRALVAAGSGREVIAVSRFTDPASRAALDASGVRTIVCDLLDPEAVAALPDAGAVVFMAGTKFGTASDVSRTWALNACVPTFVADRYQGVPTVVFSSGNVYPFVAIDSGGADEGTPPAPVGDYACSVLARERIFEHYSRTVATPVTIFRLNYATELRYGVPVDIATKVLRGEPIDLAMGHFNAIWQGDANAMALRSLGLAASPATLLNVTGPETLSVRELALRFGERFGLRPTFVGEEADTALLSDASRAIAAFGPPTVDLATVIGWIAEWVQAGGPSLDRPTHFEVRDGSF